MKIYSVGRNSSITLLLIALWLVSLNCSAETAIPALKSHVIDLTSTLSAQEVNILEQKLIVLEKNKGSQIAILIVATTQPETIEQYAIRVVDAWQLGRTGIDDGALLLIAKNDHALRIEVGYGLEGVLPDAKAKRIIDDIIIPQFKVNNFFGGINAGISAMLTLIEGESLPEPVVRHETSISASWDNFLPVLILFVVLGRLMQVMLGRLVGALVISFAVAGISWFYFFSWTITLLITFFVLVMNLLQNANHGIYRNRYGYGSDRYYRGSGFGGGFGGGGFRGGGGGFGGGGASGRW